MAAGAEDPVLNAQPYTSGHTTETGEAMTPTLTKEFPTESYMREPEQPFSASDYAFQFTQLTSFYDVPGEFGHLLEGQQYGFEALSFIVTETYPGGGPPLHTHESEEAHVLLDGEVKYVIGDQRFTVSGPYVVKIPARVPHTFLNASQQPFRMVCVFPDNRWTYQEVGPNPLVET
jgi:mannose-6-phosphate isomerase-like protein (cupin superfamily)